MITIHTIVFKLDKVNIPIEKRLFPMSARMLNIMCDPGKFGWKPIENKGGISHIDMTGFNVSSSTILKFIQIIRNRFIPLNFGMLDAVEHFAILIGAGYEKNCPFRIALDKYHKKCKEKEEIKEKKKDYPHRNPMTPKDDIYHLYKWMVSHVSTVHSGAGWVVTVQSHNDGPNHYHYYRKRKPA